MITCFIVISIKLNKNDLLNKLEEVLSQNTLFRHFFDNLEESVIMFQGQQVMYVNDMFLSKFRTLISTAQTIEIQSEAEQTPPSLWKKFKDKIFGNTAPPSKFETSFFTEPLFTAFSETQSKLGLKKQLQSELRCLSLKDLLLVAKEALAG